MSTPEFKISRTFDAPRELVWKAWTTPELMAKWWGPKGMGVVQHKMDLREGGSYHYSLRMQDGKEMWGLFIYREITPPKKLLFVSHFSDENRGITRHPFHASWPLKSLTTVSFDEKNGKTTVTVLWTPLDATAEEIKTFADNMPSMNQGWGGTLDQLEEFLKTQRKAA